MFSGLKEAVTPVGSGPTDNATAEVTPLATVTVTVRLPLVPRVTERAEAASEKVNGGAVMVRTTDAVLVTPPRTVLKVMVCAPMSAVVDTLRITAIEPVVVGAPLTVTPAGSPETENITPAA